MSSADPPPDWPPPSPYRPRRRVYVLAVVLPLLLIMALVAPFAVANLLGGRNVSNPQRSSVPVSPPPHDEGGRGVGDPYFPDYGSSGYNVSKYKISIDWDVKTQTMKATTTITARSTQTLDRLYFDLALQTDRVLVDGRPATFNKTGFQDVRVMPADSIAPDTDFVVTVTYSGAPGKIKRGDISSWYTNGQEWTVAGEPESAAWWFPSNDHPSDPALMETTVRVPAGMEAISVGRLESRDIASEKDFDTWHWLSRQPMATYLNFLSIGQFQIEEGVADGRPTLMAVSEQIPEQERAQAFAQLRKSPEIVRSLEAMFGPYPFTELGGVVPAAKLWFGGLETQTRPVYLRAAIGDEDAAPELLAHELAHMWFGDQVTLAQWNDIFTNEAYASWTAWAYEEETGGRSANESFRALFAKAKSHPNFWKITMIDPGTDHLFDTVYNRGPMTLQALRNVIGDKAFFDLARDWGQQPGSRSLEDWMVMAQTKTKTDLGPFFDVWIRGTTVPAETPENGFR